jgi:hypothetical protein
MLLAIIRADGEVPAHVPQPIEPAREQSQIRQLLGHGPTPGTEIRTLDEPVATSDRATHRIDPIDGYVQLRSRVGLANGALDERTHAPLLCARDDVARDMRTLVRGNEDVGDGGKLLI